MKKARIISQSDEPFSNRQEAGLFLARELKRFQNANAVVLGIPRGGLVVACEIASGLNADLDVVLSRKLGAQSNPEFALGAISEDGHLFLNEMIAASFGNDDTYIAREKARQMEVIKQRILQYRGILPRVLLQNRIVIVTDDGVATGATMQAALWAVRQEKPQRLIAALPVGPADTIDKLAHDADEVLCLRVPSFFAAVGQYYNDFTQVEDDEVLAMLKKEAQRKGWDKKSDKE